MDWQHFLRDWHRTATEQQFQIDVLLEKSEHPIFACQKGSPDRPTIYLSSGVHGDEPSGPQALLKLLQEGFFDERFHWIVCPAMNPTGLVAGTRENSEGIDLNRDYLQQESTEVQAHIKWLKEQSSPDLFLSLHEDWESTGFYYYEINIDTKGPDYQDILSAVSPFFPPEPELEIDGHGVTQPGWIYHPDHPDIPEGWPEAIFLARMGCPLSLTFETPSSQDLSKRIASHQAAVRCAVDQLTGL